MVVLMLVLDGTAVSGSVGFDGRVVVVLVDKGGWEEFNKRFIISH